MSLVILSACGGTTSSPASPSPSLLACTSSGQASPDWTVPATTSPAIISATVSGDTLALKFVKGTPEFEVTAEPSNKFFVGDGRGETVDMAGSAGAIIVLRGFRGDALSYTGPNDVTSGGPLLLEVRHVNEFEGNVHWAVGLSKPGCANVTATDSTLTFRFQKTG